MTSTAAINAVTDEIISRLTTAKTSLGSWVTIKERDQEPSVIATCLSEMPMIIVEPLSDRPDRIDLLQSDADSSIEHKFSLSIMGYYKFDVTTDIRTMRGYAYTCLDLFRGNKAQVATAHAYSASVNPGYYVIVDNPIYKWVVTLTFVMIE